MRHADAEFRTGTRYPELDFGDRNYEARHSFNQPTFTSSLRFVLLTVYVVSMIRTPIESTRNSGA